MRVTLVAASALALLLAACGDDDGGGQTPTQSALTTTSPTRTASQPTPPATPRATPVATATVPVTAPPDLRPCSAGELSVANLGSGAATGTVYTNYGINNNGGSPCALAGPPGLRLEDASGTDLQLEIGAAVPCGQNPEPDPYCVLHGSLALPPATETPGRDGPPPGASVVVAISNTGNYPLCDLPHVFAETIVIAFPDTGELAVPLGGWELQVCQRQVTLYSFK